MKLQPTLDILPSLLFAFDVDSDQNVEAEEQIASTDINNELELTKLFDAFIMPDFTSRIASEQQWYIDSLTFYLEKNESFNRIFSDMTTYFPAPPSNKRNFMKTLLNCLKKYQAINK
jgi:hypothetical protein